MRLCGGKRRVLAAIALVALLLNACGQTGALFLPEDPPAEAETDQTDEE